MSTDISMADLRAAMPAAAPVTERMAARPTVTAPKWAVLGETPAHATITGVFYAVCLLGGVFGQTLVGVSELALPVGFALALACALELAGVKFAYDAAVARAAGEHAIVPQVLSYSLAAVAVGVNVLGHLAMGDVFGAAVYGLFSALAFIAFTVRAEFRRRQADREAGKAAHPTPAYGARRWIFDRATTSRAKALAAADPTLGLYGSLEAAKAALAAEARRTEIASMLRRKALADFGGDKLRAAIEVAKYDLDKIAAELCARADHTAAVAAIEADLDANRSTPATPRPAIPAADENTTAAPATPRRKARTGTGKTRRSGTARTASDAELIERLAEVERDADGTVPIRRAARELGTGPTRAKRLLTAAGLLAADPVSATD